MFHSVRIFAAPIIILLFFTSVSIAAEKTVIEEQAKDEKINLGEERIRFNSSYDYGWVKQESGKGKWRVFTENIAYSVNEAVTPYLEVNTLDRFHQKDYTIGFGSYFKFKDFSNINIDIGFGGDIDYVYKFQNRIEYEHRLVNDYFYKLGYRYLNYADNDVFIIYPGITYYFGDNNVSVLYNIIFTESRDTAQSAVVKGNFVFGKFLNLDLGLAIGERLYDIAILKASEQYGFIIFSGLNFNLSKRLSLRLGYSYSTEKPNFIKRSLDLGVSLKI